MLAPSYWPFMFDYGGNLPPGEPRALPRPPTDPGLHSEHQNNESKTTSGEHEIDPPA